MEDRLTRWHNNKHPEHSVGFKTTLTGTSASTVDEFLLHVWATKDDSLKSVQWQISKVKKTIFYCSIHHRDFCLRTTLQLLRILFHLVESVLNFLKPVNRSLYILRSFFGLFLRWPRRVKTQHFRFHNTK